jgi:hypothetical protein
VISAALDPIFCTGAGDRAGKERAMKRTCSGIPLAILVFLLLVPPVFPQDLPAAAPVPSLQARPALEASPQGSASYGGEFDVARSSLRTLMGLLTPDEEKKFMAQWAPQYDFPNAEAKAYYEKLNPLLEELLTLRQAMLQAAREHDAALRETELAWRLDDEEGFREAEGIVLSQKSIILSGEKRARELLAAIEKLGDPPDASGAKKKARRNHMQARAVAEKACGEEAAAPERQLHEGWWILTEKKVNKDQFVTYTGTGVTGTCKVDHPTDGWTATFSHSWTAPPPRIHAGYYYTPNPGAYTGGKTENIGDTVKLSGTVRFDSWKWTGEGPGDGRIDKSIPPTADAETRIWASLDPTMVTGVYGINNKDAKVQTKRGSKTDEATCTFRAPFGPNNDPKSQLFIYIPSYGSGGRGYSCGVTYVYSWDPTGNTVKPFEDKEAPPAPAVGIQAAPAASPQAVDPAEEVRKIKEEDERAKAERIAESEANINNARKYLSTLEGDLSAEKAGKKDAERIRALEFAILQQKSNIHDEENRIASVKSGEIVSTRGPFEEYASALLIESCRKEVRDFTVIQQEQAAAQRLIAILEKYSPEEAEKARKFAERELGPELYASRDVAKAQKAVEQVHALVENKLKAEQAYRESRQEYAARHAAVMDGYVKAAESIKTNSGRALMVLSLGAEILPAMAVQMAYEAGVGFAEGATPSQVAVKAGTSLLIVGGVMGVTRLGGYVLGKMLAPAAAEGAATAGKGAAEVIEGGAPKVGEVFQGAKFADELANNQALVQQAVEKLAGKRQALVAARAAKESPEVIAKLEKEVDELVSSIEGSTLAKRSLKTEVKAAEKAAEGAEAGSAEAARLEKIQKTESAYLEHLAELQAKTRSRMVEDLQKQGYNVEDAWFTTFRNQSSRGVNNDLDLGLFAEMEGKLLKGGKPITLQEFMKDAQKAYDGAFKSVTGRSAKLADQNVTTSAFSEAFPLEWLSKNENLIAAADPASCAKAGQAIINKVQNAMSGPDPFFVNLQKAGASLAKDIRTKLLVRLKKTVPQAPGASPNALTKEALEQAGQHYEEVAKVLDDFAANRIDPLTASRKVRELTGGCSLSEIAKEAGGLLKKLGESQVK